MVGPPIKHKLDVDGRYLCNKSLSVDVDKLTTCSGRVTCKNCKKALANRRKRKVKP